MPAYSGYTDAKLTSLLSNGDKLACTEIYKRYNALLYLHAYRRLNDREDAKDVVHELFTLLWVKRGELRIKTSLAAYLYTSVRNRIFDVISHKKVESGYIVSLQHFIDEGDYMVDRLVRENELMALIEKEIASLPPKMRQVFELSRKHYLSHKEIAKELNLSEQTVRKQVNNALRILRVKLGSLLYLVL